MQWVHIISQKYYSLTCPRQSLEERAKVDNLLAYNAGTVRPAITDTYVIELGVLPKLFGIPGPAIERIYQIYKEKLCPVFDYLEQHLKGKKFLTGPNLTIADFAIYEEFNTGANICKMDINKYGNIKKWM